MDFSMSNFYEVFRDTDVNNIIEIYNTRVDQVNTEINLRFKKIGLRKLTDLKPNFIYTDTSFENQTYFSWNKNSKNNNSILYETISNFNTKEASIAVAMLIASLNKNNLIDAKIMINHNYRLYTDYENYFLYGVNGFDGFFKTSVHINNSNFYEMLILTNTKDIDDENKKLMSEEDAWTKSNGEYLSELFSIQPKNIMLNRREYFFDDNIKLSIIKNKFDKIIVGLFINSIKNKKYIEAVRAFDGNTKLNKMLYIIITDTLEYLKTINKRSFNPGDSLLKLKACVSKLIEN